MEDKRDEVLLKVEHLCQYFKMGKSELKAVDDVSFDIKKGEDAPLLNCTISPPEIFILRGSASARAFAPTRMRSQKKGQNTGKR